MTEQRAPILPRIADDLAEVERRAAAERAQPEKSADAVVSRVPPRHSRTRPATVTYDERRRLWSAGHAMVVCVLALGISLFLNAPGIHKKAYNLSDGWQRDVALALTGPLAGVSNALRFDRPREALQAAIGRSGTDDIDTEVIVAAQPEAETPGRVSSAGSATRKGGAKTAATVRPTRTRARTPGKVAFSPRRPMRVWIAGDSLAVVPGYAILRAGADTKVITGAMDGRVATGLTRPDVFNWFAQIKAQTTALKPHVVVLGFGGNDDKAYMTGLPASVRIASFGDAAWQREYSRRVGGVLDTVARAGGYAVWLGLPHTADAGRSARYATVDATARAEVAKRPRSATFIDTASLLSPPDGGYAEYLTRPDGSTVKVRAGDGIHLDPAGGDIVARAVIAALSEKFDLTSWRR